MHVLGSILKYIPGVQEARNEEVSRDPRFLEFLPDHFKTQEMCIKALEVNPWLLKYVPDNLKTRETNEKAVNIEPWLLAYVPNNLKTQEMCKKAVGEDTNMLKYIPDQYIIQEMCARDCPWPIGHEPDHFKAQEMCTRVLEVCPWSLEYIPDWFVTQQQIKLQHDEDDHCNDDRLIEWYEDHKKPKAQKVSTKEEVLPIARHPSRLWDWCVSEDEKKKEQKNCGDKHRPFYVW